MTMTEEALDVREAVGVFKGPADLQDAIDELLSSGFNRAELSLLAGEAAVTEKLGHRYGKTNTLADEATAPRTHYVSPEAIGGAEAGLIGAFTYVGAVTATGAVIASGGTLAALVAATALVGGGGALIGTLMAKFIGDNHARYLQDQMDHGGLLLWVRAWNAADERTAVAILKRHSAGDVHVHALPAAVQ